MTEAELQQRIALVRQTFRYWLEYVGWSHEDIAVLLTLSTFTLNLPTLAPVVPVKGHLSFGAAVNN